MLIFHLLKAVGAERLVLIKFKHLSDHRDLSFGEAYGIAMQENRLLARAVFVVDSNDTVTYAEYVSEATDHPNYEAAIEAAKQAK